MPEFDYILLYFCLCATQVNQQYNLKLHYFKLKNDRFYNKIVLINLKVKEDKIMDLQCINCGVQFNYFDRVATIVCDQNHVICKVCADALKKINARCPTCRLPIIGTINYKSPINYNNPTFNNYDRTENLYNQPNPSPYWQSNQNQGFNPQPHSINQPYHGNHPRQAQPYNQGFQPIAPIQRNNVKKFGIAAFICGVAFIVLLVVRLQMDGFDPQTVPIMFGLFISAFLTLVFSCQFINARRQNRMMQIARAGNYMRA